MTTLTEILDRYTDNYEKALIPALEQWGIEQRIDELSHFEGWEEWFDKQNHKIITVKDRLKQLHSKAKGGSHE